MRRQLQGIALILFSILLTLVVGDAPIGDLDIWWSHLFLAVGVVGVVMTFWQEITSWFKKENDS